MQLISHQQQLHQLLIKTYVAFIKNHQKISDLSAIPSLRIVWLLFKMLSSRVFCVTCECVWSTHSESGSVGHSWWLAAVQDSCLSCPLVSDSSSSSPRWCEAYGEAVCVNAHRQEIRQRREMKIVTATLCSFSASKLKIIFRIHGLVTGRNGMPAIHPGWPDKGLYNFRCLPSTLSWEPVCPAPFYSRTAGALCQWHRCNFPPVQVNES